MALALASTCFCRTATFLVSASMAPFRSSPMWLAQEATDDEDGDDGLAAAVGRGLGLAAMDGSGGCAAVEGGKDRLDRDTRLSKKKKGVQP